MTKPSLFYKINAKIQSYFGYGCLLGHKFSGFLSLGFEYSPNKHEKDLNKLLIGYPRNHDYSICKKQLFPSFKLYERFKLVTSFYPEELEKFIDIGSCRGFYVMEAAQRPHCQVSIGIDVYEPFVSISNKVREYLDIKNADFYLATLDQVSDRPEAYGGPFQTVLLIGAYHYLFWGSKLSSSAYYSHREILTRLSKISTDRLIFSARLEVDRLPTVLKEKAKMLGNKIIYNTEYFLKIAEQFFEVRKAGYLGRYPLFVMSKKNS